MHKKAFIKCILPVAVICFFTTIVSGQLCSSLIEFSEEDDLKIGRFDVNSELVTDNTYIQIIVYVSNSCKANLCTFTAEADIKNVGKLYRAGKPIAYIVKFRGASKDAYLKGIALRNSNACQVICRNESEIVAPGSKSIKYSFYPYGSLDHKASSCDPINAFLPPTSTSTETEAPAIVLPIDNTCGTISHQTHFIHLAFRAQEIRRGSWPWLVALYELIDNNHRFFCGGTLISKRIVLTANHCMAAEFGKLFLPEELILFMGRHNRTDYNENGFVQYGVHDIVRHPDYRGKQNFDADIAFLVTDRNVEYTQFIRPACIWDGDESIESLMNQTGTVVGWGLDERLRTTVLPKKIEGIIVSDQECLASNIKFEGITSKRNFCAGKRDGSGPCTGDSGGAFMMKKNNQWMIRGIVSGSLRDTVSVCDLTNYVVYTDVVKFKYWLDTEIPKHKARSMV